jgi:hypothetical protein
MGFIAPSCTNRLGPVSATQSAGSVGKANLPDIALEHSKECMEFDGRQLGPGRVVVESTVTVDEDGNKLAINSSGLPEAALDFGTCIRKVLLDMPIAKQPLEEGAQMLKFHMKHAGDSQEALIKFMNLMPGVLIVESELFLEADGYTAVLPVTVKVVPDLEKFAALDKEILQKIGQMALDSLGYEEIMKRAEQVGWVKRVRVPRARAAANKRFFAQDAATIAEDVFTRVFTKAAPVALLASQADSFLPGPGDIGGLGIMAGALIVAGAITVYTIATAPATTITSAPPVTTATATPTATATTTTTSPPIVASRRCLPCLPVPVGGIAYEYHSAAAGNQPHDGMPNHTHHFKMNQSPPAAGCLCFWKRNFISPTPEFSPLPGAVPVAPAAGGGIAHEIHERYRSDGRRRRCGPPRSWSRRRGRRSPCAPSKLTRG